MAEFDWTTHYRSKQGKIVRTNEYRLEIVDGVKRMERPLGSGFWYNEKDELVQSPKEASKPEFKEEVKPAVQVQKAGK